MPTPEQQREYTRLSGMLQNVGIKYLGEMPSGTVTLSLMLGREELQVEAYDGAGKLLGTVPNQSTSDRFASDLQSAFAKETFTDDAIVAIIRNPIKIQPR